MVQLTPAEMNRLQEKFTDYQLLERAHIPENNWAEALVYEDKTDGDTPNKQYFRMDMVWGYIANIKNADDLLRFWLLK